MKFVHPNILYFLLVLIIPIIIHLFNFRRYKKLYFSSLFFIKKIDKETNSTKKLRHYLILASRMLAFTSLVIAFAQPYFPNDNRNSQNKNSIIPIYIDNSYSMSANGINGTLLNQSKAMVRQITDTYSKNQNYVLVTNELSGFEHRVISKVELENRLNTITFSPVSRSISTPIASVADFLSRENYQGNTHYFILSDFQDNTLSTTTANVDTNAFYSSYQLSTQITSNLYIDSVWFNQPFQRVGENSSLNVRIVNTGNEALTNVELHLEIGDTKRQALVDLPANNSTITTLNFNNENPGTHSGSVEIVDANIYFDNTFYFTYTIAEELSVLIINGENSTNFPTLVYQTDDFYKVKETKSNQLQINELSTANLIVLNGLKTISSGIQTKIKQLAKGGTHFLIIPSMEFDAITYNNLLSDFKLPLLQATPSENIRIGKINSHLSFFDGMFRKETDKIRMPPLNKYLSTSIYTSSNFIPLITYENNMPLLAQQGDNGTVFFIYSAINPEFNDFGQSALFASVLLRVGEVSQGNQPLYLTIGSDKNYSITARTEKDEPIVLQKGDFKFIPQLRKSTGKVAITSVKPIEVSSVEDGVYTIHQSDETLGEIAFNFNREESQMDVVDKSKIDNYFSELSIHNRSIAELNSLKDIQNFAVEKPNELWRLFLILALLFLLIEMALINFWKV